MRRIFTFFLTFLLGVFVTALYAQTHTVSGTVIDKDANEPLIGANVLIKALIPQHYSLTLFISA